MGSDPFVTRDSSRASGCSRCCAAVRLRFMLPVFLDVLELSVWLPYQRRVPVMIAGSRRLVVGRHSSAQPSIAGRAIYGGVAVSHRSFEMLRRSRRVWHGRAAAVRLRLDGPVSYDLGSGGRDPRPHQTSPIVKLGDPEHFTNSHPYEAILGAIDASWGVLSRKNFRRWLKKNLGKKNDPGSRVFHQIWTSEGPNVVKSMSARV